MPETKFKNRIENKRFKYIIGDLLRDRKKSTIARSMATYGHTIDAIIKGERKLTLDQIKLLANAYGINTNYIFGLSDQMYSDYAGDNTQMTKEAILGALKDIQQYIFNN